MGTRASIVGRNLNHLIKKSTICAVAIILATLVRHKSFFDECRPCLFPLAVLVAIIIMSLMVAGSLLWLWRINKW